MEVRLVAAGAARDLSRQRIAEGGAAMLLRGFFGALGAGYRVGGWFL